MRRMVNAPLAAALTVLVFAAAAVDAQTAPAAADAAALSPVKLLLTMKRVYGGCRSYRDTGIVKMASVSEDTRIASEVPFTTAFVRPGPLRFAFTDRGLGERASTCVLWWNGAEVHSWWDVKPGERLAESLQQALDAAAGISGGASLRVPGLLLPAVVGAGPPLVSPERIADASDRDVACLRLKGKSRATPYTQTIGGITETIEDESVTLWIDRTKLLLRKVEEERTLSRYRATTTTTYSPEIDVEIPPVELAFNPPAPPAEKPQT